MNQLKKFENNKKLFEPYKSSLDEIDIDRLESNQNKIVDKKQNLQKV